MRQVRAGLRACAAGLLLCLGAVCLVITAEPPVDSYVLEYMDECVLRRNCPIIDWAPGPHPHAHWLIVSRQIRGSDDGTGTVMVSPAALPMIDLEMYLAAKKMRRHASSVAK